MAINFNRAEFVLSAVRQGAFIRDGRAQVTFAGRSNVGKSSVINRLLNRKNFARVGATPGKTTTTSSSTERSTSRICPATATQRSARTSATAGGGSWRAIFRSRDSSRSAC